MGIATGSIIFSLFKSWTYSSTAALAFLFKYGVLGLYTGIASIKARTTA